MYLSSKKKAAEILLAITAIIALLCFLYISATMGNAWGNHTWTMTEVGRHPRRSPCPTTLFNHTGHLELPSSLSKQAFEYLQDGDPVTSLGNQCQCLITLLKEGHPVISKVEVATIKLCTCQASDSDTRPFKRSEIKPLQLQPSSSCSFNPLRSTLLCSSSHTF